MVESISAAAFRLVISDAGSPLSCPALPSNTQGPTLFLGVIGPSAPPPGGEGVRPSLKWLARPEPDIGFRMGNGSLVVCGCEDRAVGISGEGITLTVTSITSMSCTGDSGGCIGAVGWTGAGWTLFEVSASCDSFNPSSCCHSSFGSSTSASRSAPARQLGQTKMGYCGDMSSDFIHLKCHVCEQGATKRDWHGCEIDQSDMSHKKQGKLKLTAMEFRQMAQSCEFVLVTEPPLDVMVRSLLWAAMLQERKR